MFLVYAPVGAMWPLFSRRLEMLHFTPWQIAVACATQALGTLVAPLLAGQIADRWVPAERCLTCCAFAAGGLLWVLADCTTPADVFLVSLAFWLVMAPLMTLATATSFGQLREPWREYGRVRLWGTIGWIVPGWILLYALGPDAMGLELPDAFRLGTGLLIVLAIYSLSLPHTPPRREAVERFAPLAALRLFHRRDFAVFFIAHLTLCLTLPFSAQNTVLLLEKLGIGDEWKAATMTIAQSTEVLTLGLLPWLLARWGQRRVMLIGAGAWALAMAVMMVGRPVTLVVASLGLNGLYITCFFVAGQVFVNSHASQDVRASVQALISFTTGVGMLAGYGLSGWVRDLAGGAFGPTFAVAAALATVAVVVFAAGFRPAITAE